MFDTQHILKRMYSPLVKRLQQTDLPFLLFLILFLNVKLPLKLAGLVLIYALRRNFKFGLNNGRLPFFNLLMIALSVLGYFLTLNFGLNYLVLCLAIIFVWAAGFLATHQVKLAIETNGINKVQSAFDLFLAINTLLSFGKLLLIIKECGWLNPYTYEGLSLKYHASTGDYIKGLTFDICTTNMVINAMAMFYFLYRGKAMWSVICMSIVLLTGSNLGNIIIVAFLILALIFDRNKFHKSMTMIFASLLVLFIIKVSSSNIYYYKRVFKSNPDIVQTNNKPQVNAESREVMPLAPAITIKKRLNTDSILRAHVKINMKKVETGKVKEAWGVDSTFNRVQMQLGKITLNPLRSDNEYKEHSVNEHLKVIQVNTALFGDSLTYQDIPYMKSENQLGKITSFVQTWYFMLGGVKNGLLGAGPGNFSGKFAFRASGINYNGNWPAELKYLSPDFKDNHFKTWLFYQIQDPSKHSVINFPNSSLNQILGEYGLLGLIVFVVFYLMFFVSKFKVLSYGRIILPLFMLFLTTEYWFENLSVVIVFELLMFLDLAGVKSLNEQ